MKERAFPQISLPLSNSQTTGVDDIPDAVIASYPTMLKAINVAITVSGVSDERVAEIIGTSPANLSKYLNGQYNFPPDKLDPLMTGLGNEIPLRWLALKRGKKLKPMLSTLEEKLNAANSRNAELELQLDTITKFLQRVGLRLA